MSNWWTDAYGQACSCAISAPSCTPPNAGATITSFSVGTVTQTTIDVTVTRSANGSVTLLWGFVPTCGSCAIATFNNPTTIACTTLTASPSVTFTIPKLAPGATYTLTAISDITYCDCLGSNGGTYDVTLTQATSNSSAGQYCAPPKFAYACNQQNGSADLCLEPPPTGGGTSGPCFFEVEYRQIAPNTGPWLVHQFSAGGCTTTLGFVLPSLNCDPDCPDIDTIYEYHVRSVCNTSTCIGASVSNSRVSEWTDMYNF